MLDIHAVGITPGAVLVYGAAGGAVAVGDLATTAGVPVSDGAVMVLHGINTPTADSVAAYKMISQDCIDPINGETFTPGAASLLNQWYKFTKLPYKTGGRLQYAGTNVGVVAAHGFTVDAYQAGNCVEGSYSMPGSVVTGLTTFGGALVTNAWGSQAFAPATALPNGSYAILGAWVSAVANACAIGFQHADFGPYIPGFPAFNYETISSATWDKAMKHELTLSQHGYQFAYLSQVLGIPCCPVFRITNAGTGLNVRALSVQTDTPLVTVNLAKVG